MFLNEEDARAFPGLSQGDDLPVAFEGGLAVYFSRSEGMLLQIGERATIDDIRKAWPQIAEWRRRWIQKRGPWVQSVGNSFYIELHKHLQLGRSYANIAGRINRRIEEHLREYTEYVKEFEAARPRFRTMMDFYLWEHEHNPFSLDHALDLMHKSGISEEDAKAWAADALKSIQNGVAPFPPDAPTSGEMIRERVRSWRKKWGDRVVEIG